jgi:hypothetical protein
MLHESYGISSSGQCLVCGSSIQLHVIAKHSHSGSDTKGLSYLGMQRILNTRVVLDSSAGFFCAKVGGYSPRRCIST